VLLPHPPPPACSSLPTPLPTAHACNVAWLFSASSTHYFLGGIAFLKVTLDTIIGQWCPPSQLNVSFLLCGPNVPGPNPPLDVAFCLSSVTPNAPPTDVVLPHPRWFKDKMAKPALDLAACTAALPAFFR